jgi:uncharacterized protein YjbJ (UPF0337 family)
MTQNRLAGMWRQIRGEAEALWGKMTDDPQITADGIRDQRAGKVQIRLAIAQESAARQLKDFYQRNRNWDLSNR